MRAASSATNPIPLPEPQACPSRVPRALPFLVPFLALFAACTTPQPAPLVDSSAASASVSPRPERRASPPAPPPTEAAPLVPAPRAAAAELPPVWAGSPLRVPTDWVSSLKNPLRRVDEARAMKLAEVKGLFSAAGVAFPPAKMYLRAFKREKVLELWAASEKQTKLSLIASYKICYASGGIGPKRREGDWQVPEGLYKIKDTLPATPFYLALHIDYPNNSDRILGDKRKPGGEILIHGSCVSVGCLSMTDERAAEIYVAASAFRSAGGSIDIHIFPTREMAALLASPEGKEHGEFWENLRPFLDAFEASRVVPRYRIDKDGRYRLL